jgi:hypothetical protein
MTEKLDPEAKRLRNISPGDLADAIGALEARIEVLEGRGDPARVAPRRGRGLRIVLTAPGITQRTDKPRLTPASHRLPNSLARWGVI